MRTLTAVWSTGLALFPLLLFGAARAGAQGAPFPPPGLATIVVTGGPETENFVVRVTDQQLLDEIWAIVTGTAPQKIVIGKILTGNDGYNQMVYPPTPWSWHLDETSLQLAEITVEVCDGGPSMVEADILGFGAGWFCPWSGVLAGVLPGFGIDADTNVDGVVDQTDADKVAQCLTGAGQRCVDIMPSCCQADIDSDLDVDCSDWAAVEEQWTGAGAPAPPEQCAAFPVPTLSRPWLAMALVVSVGLAALYAGDLARVRADRRSAAARRRIL